MIKKYLIAAGLIVTMSTTLTIYGCKKGLNLFTIEDDKQLGAQTAAEIASNPAEFPILDRTQYASSYNYLFAMRNEILASGQVEHANDFDWELNIIHDDATLNAFCTPGGHIYVYTGLIKYLDDASSLAGVLGHEMAHADRRHSTQQLTKLYGIETLLSLLTGTDAQLLAEVSAQLVALKFSRTDETDADTHSVIYLCPTKYHADGAANFFQKIIDEGSPQPPQFLSTHPNPDNRVQNIQSQSAQKGCTATIQPADEVNAYNQFKNSLP
jgi:predicted Zn-dependent protease